MAGHSTGQRPVYVRISAARLEFIRSANHRLMRKKISMVAQQMCLEPAECMDLLADRNHHDGGLLPDSGVSAVSYD